MNTKKIKCFDCIKKHDTCCEGRCSRFVTLHDLLRLKKLGFDPDAVSSFQRMLAWERKSAKDQVHCYFYDLALDGKLLMLKKGKKNCIFLGTNSLCQIHRVGILFCKIFPFWFVERNKKIKIIFDPDADACPIAPKFITALNRRILAGQTEIADSYFEKIGESRQSILKKYRQFRSEMAAYKKYRQALAQGEKPSAVIKKYHIHL